MVRHSVHPNEIGSTTPDMEWHKTTLVNRDVRTIALGCIVVLFKGDTRQTVLDDGRRPQRKSWSFVYDSWRAPKRHVLNLEEEARRQAGRWAYTNGMHFRSYWSLQYVLRRVCARRSSVQVREELLATAAWCCWHHSTDILNYLFTFQTKTTTTTICDKRKTQKHERPLCVLCSNLLVNAASTLSSRTPTNVALCTKKMWLDYPARPT